ncbi:MAG: arginine--tRNA ligase [Planctomycetota bacterium]
MDHVTSVAQALSAALAGPPFGQDRSASDLRPLIEVPKDHRMGDHAFPCFSLAKGLRKAPAQIASELAAALSTSALAAGGIASAEAVGPYVNFRVDRAALARTLIPAIISGAYLAPRPTTGRRVMIEYSQPNTHKAFHVGHTRNVALGDSLVRLFEWAGHTVIAANYIGDVGTHIAKCLWYYRTYFRGEVPATHRGEFLGKLYAQADELLDFTTLTRSPYPDVIAARVLDIRPHPRRADLQVATVDAGSGKPVQVVCGGTGYRAGELVAYAKPGAQVGGRRVEVADKDGVESVGMICSENEVSLSEDPRQIALLPPATALGTEIAEIFRVPGVLAPDRSVVAEIRERQAGVSATLKELEAGGNEVHALWRETREWSLAEFAEIYRWLEARFDHFFYESEVGDAGKQIVYEYLEKGILVRSEGAVGADLSAFNLPFFLVLKSDGTGLYSTKDLALARLKFDRFAIDLSIYVVDVGQSLHFQQVFRTLELMGYEKARDCFHLAYGMVMVPEGKMSSRKGNVILFSQLQDQLIAHIRREFLDKYAPEWPAEEIAQAARRIAIATIKYGMLNHDPRKNIVFDLAEWTQPTGNTGPYLLYAYTRTQSILRELAGYDPGLADWSLATHETEGNLIRRLQGFPEIALQAVNDHSAHGICIYLYELARDFSRMYTECKVLTAEPPALRMARAALVDATGKTLQCGLGLLGIQTLARM